MPEPVKMSEWDAGRIDDGLNIYVGSLSSVHYEALKERNISSVLTVAGCLKVWTDNSPPPDISWKKVSVADHPAENIIGHIPKCLEFLELALKSDGGVLIHCASGVSRSVSICCAYLMDRQGITYKEALAKVRVCRPQAKPNPGFERQLELLEMSKGQVEPALLQWESEIAKLGPVMDRIRVQRNSANNLHAQVDQLETDMSNMQLSTVSRDRKVYLERLSVLLVALDAEDCNKPNSAMDRVAGCYSAEDRVAASIRKSAKEKGERLFDDLHEWKFINTLRLRV